MKKINFELKEKEAQWRIHEKLQGSPWCPFMVITNKEGDQVRKGKQGEAEQC